MITEIIKGILALVLVIGSGVLTYLKPDFSSYTFPLIGFIIGYYFGEKKIPIVSALRKG